MKDWYRLPFSGQTCSDLLALIQESPLGFYFMVNATSNDIVLSGVEIGKAIHFAWDRVIVVLEGHLGGGYYFQSGLNQGCVMRGDPMNTALTKERQQEKLG